LIAGVMAGFSVTAVPGSQGAVLALFALAMLPMGASPRWVHLGLENARAVSLSRLVAELLRVVLLVVFVHGPEHLLRVPLALLGGEIAATLLLLLQLRAKNVHLRPVADVALVRNVLRRGFPLLLTNLLALVIYNADIVLLRVLRNETEVGLYLGAYTLINLLGVLGNTATLSILPSLSRLRGAPGQGIELYHAGAAQVLAVALPLSVGGALLAPWIIDLVFGSSYAASAAVLRILIASIPVLLLRCVAQATLLAAGRQDRVLHSTALAAIVTIALNIVLIPMIGMSGAAITTVAAESARLLAVLAYSHAEGYPLPAVGRAARAAMATALMAGVLFLVRGPGLWLSLPAGAATYTLTLFALGGLRWSNGRLRISV
jgi:O-antigen/teichoic acid export membrane protein